MIKLPLCPNWAAVPIRLCREAAPRTGWQAAARGKAGTGRRVPTCAARGPAPAFPSPFRRYTVVLPATGSGA
ncbi:hypothetical protein GCM10010250_03260 [Streptomyces althioticus]|nr:hypothetical protein GCM10010250_03260 [Streptomyces althioticus]